MTRSEGEEIVLRLQLLLRIGNIRLLRRSVIAFAKPSEPASAVTLKTVQKTSTTMRDYRHAATDIVNTDFADQAGAGDRRLYRRFFVC